MSTDPFLAYLDTVEAVLSTVEEKRVVRDAAYWGAPVGTPLPLPPKVDGVRFSLSSSGEYIYGSISGRVPETNGNSIAMAFDSFDVWEGNYAIRTVSARMMGIPGVQSYGDEGLDVQVRDILNDGHAGYDFLPNDKLGFVKPQPDAVSDVRRAVNNTAALMRASTRTTLDHQVFRGISVKDGHPLLSAKEGDTITFPISAFSPSSQTAMQYGMSAEEGESPVLFILQPGAKVAHTPFFTEEVDEGGLDEEGNALPWVTRPIETLAQGKFEVIGVKAIPKRPAGALDFLIGNTDKTLIAIRQTHYYDIDSGEYVHV